VVTTTKKSSGSVAGTKSTTSSYNALMPLNSIFRQVYGRTPTFEEWTYWANRFLTEDKFKVNGQWRYDALLGAMQWQHSIGRSIGA
jgi:hypothetical protein